MRKMIKGFSVGSISTALCVILAVVTLAISLQLYTQTKTTSFQKKSIFKSDMTIGSSNTLLGPGESVNFAPSVHNDATQPMYAFIKLIMPSVNNENLYDYLVDDSWYEVESGEGYIVYAYIDTDSNMCVLELDETTPTLTTQVTMKNISNAVYAGIDDINITVKSYVISVDGVSTNPQVAWIQCKNINS